MNGKIQRGIASIPLTNFFNFGFYVCASGVTLPYGKKAYSRFITFDFTIFDDNTVFLVLDSDVTYWW